MSWNGRAGYMLQQIDIEFRTRALQRAGAASVLLYCRRLGKLTTVDKIIGSVYGRGRAVTAMRRARSWCRMQGQRRPPSDNRGRTNGVTAAAATRRWNERWNGSNGRACRETFRFSAWLSEVITLLKHGNVARSTASLSSFDNIERHVTAFRPIREAARSLSCDNTD